MDGMSIRERIASARKKALEEKRNRVKRLCNEKNILIPIDLKNYTEKELDNLISRLLSDEKSEIERHII